MKVSHLNKFSFKWDTYIDVSVLPNPQYYERDLETQKSSDFCEKLLESSIYFLTNRESFYQEFEKMSKLFAKNH